MPIDWRDYDRFDWAGARQAPLRPDQRSALTDWAADLLELSPADRADGWGSASPPGRFAATVVRLAPNLQHRYRAAAAALGIDDVGVKVFKTTGDAQREARRVVPCHRTGLRRLLGLPNERVQQSVDAGVRRDGQGEERAFVVQQWVDGDSLEDLVRRRWPADPAGGDVIRSILDQLLGGIIIPLWGAGTVWWDVRDANYCYAISTGRLSLIDVDSLGAYADEVLHTPHVWDQRDKGRATALARLRQMAIRLLLAQGRHGKRRVETGLAAAWQAELEPALSRLGKAADGTADAARALARFFDRLASEGLLAPRGGGQGD